MLQALLQTIANLGFGAQAVNTTFNNILDSIQGGDTSSVSGIMGIFKGVVSAFTGVNSADLSLIASSLVTSVLEVLTNSGTTNMLSTITGA